MKRLELSTFEEVEITLQKINQYRGIITQDDAAKRLGVSVSTLKRRCQDLGLGRWPKRKIEHSLHSSDERLKKTKSFDFDGISFQQDAIGLFSSNNALFENVVTDAYPTWTGDDEIQHFAVNGERVGIVPTSENAKGIASGYNEIGCCASNNTKENEPATIKCKSVRVAPRIDENDQGNNVIAVVATYKDDTTLLPLCCNSGIKELCAELEDAFQLGDEKYKVKYKYGDGRWITLFRDKDLRFYIETLKALGQSTMEVSVFPDSS